jgi:alginate O-acetyltransferase complex protein AlgI
MLFNSIEFIFIFLPIVTITFYTLKGRGNLSLIFIVLASLFFYGYSNPFYLALLICSIIFNYFTGLILWSITRLRKTILIISILANLGTLGYFKYANFFIENINVAFDLSYTSKNIILPLAISFFTFQQIAFLVDSFKHTTNQCTLLEYAFFTTFFPHLLAGPILNHKTIIPQARVICSMVLDWRNLAIGISIFIIGLFKKVILADTFGTYSDEVFSRVAQDHAITFSAAWIGVLGFALQIYFDFSAYSDMAYGLGRIFGVILPINFLSPYKATSMIEFWRRWHISLSSFLRDYLYVPIGGNRNGLFRTRMNLLITMLLGGLWHGPSWTFIVWGGLNGIYLVINHEWRRLTQSKGDSKSPSVMSIILCWPIVFISTLLAWVFFRIDSLAHAMVMLRAMMGLDGIALPRKLYDLTQLMPNIFTNAIPENPIWLSGTQPALSLALFSIALMIILLLPNPYEYFLDKSAENHSSTIINIRNEFFFDRKFLIIGLSVLAIISIINIKSRSDFIYFQF